MSDSSEQKTDPASKRKLDKQRKKGVIAQAAEMSNYVGQMLSIVALLLIAPVILLVVEIGISNSLELMNDPVAAVLHQSTKNSIQIYLLSAAPIVLVSVSSGVIVKMIYQRGILFAIDPIIPKLERIDPMSGLKRIFGMRGWVELSISMGRLVLWAGAFALIVHAQFGKFLSAVVCGLSCLVDVGLDSLFWLLLIAAILFIVFALIEGLLQKFLFSHEQKMTKTEVKREQKDQFGSKEVRRSRKQFGKDIEKLAATVGAHKATMALYFEDQAVAIRFHPESEPVPILSAKATNMEEAIELRAIVRENGWEETESEAIVLGMISRPPGEYMPAKLYKDFGAAAMKMYN